MSRPIQLGDFVNIEGKGLFTLRTISPNITIFDQSGTVYEIFQDEGGNWKIRGDPNSYNMTFIAREQYRPMKSAYVDEIAPQTGQTEDVVSYEELPEQSPYVHSFVPIIWGDRKNFPQTRFVSTNWAANEFLTNPSGPRNLITHEQLPNDEISYIQHYQQCLDLETSQQITPQIIQEVIRLWKEGILTGNAWRISRCFITPETLYEHFRNFDVVSDEENEAHQAWVALQTSHRGSWLLRHSSIMRIAPQSLKDWMAKTGVHIYTLTYKDNNYDIKHLRFIHWPGIGWGEFLFDMRALENPDLFINLVNSVRYTPSFFDFLNELLSSLGLTARGMHSSYV